MELNNSMFTVLLVFIVCLVVSCGEEEYTGDELINYPDLELVLNEGWNMDSARNYLKVSRNMKGADSSVVAHVDMPWEEINSLFKKANLQKEKLDHHYKIDMLKDSASQATTFFYESVVPDDYTRSVSIVGNEQNQGVSSLYFETSEGDKKSKRVLFVPQELLQIQMREPQSITVDTYYFE